MNRSSGGVFSPEVTCPPFRGLTTGPKSYPKTRPAVDLIPGRRPRIRSSPRRATGKEFWTAQGLALLKKRGTFRTCPLVASDCSVVKARRRGAVEKCRSPEGSSRQFIASKGLRQQLGGDHL